MRPAAVFIRTAVPSIDLQGAPAPVFRPVRFTAVFAAVFALLHAIYFAVPDPILRDVVHYRAVVAPAAWLIRLVAPGEPVTAAAGTLNSPRASLDIVRGCDGAGVAFLLVAAVLAFPAGPARKLAGASGALAFAWLLNLLRVAGLYFAAAYRHEWFNLLHNLLVPTFVIVVCCMMFAWWAAWSAGARSG